MAIQTSTKEMTKERLALRKTDPVKANVLLMIIDGVKTITINERREETAADIANSAKKLYAEVQSNIEEYKKGGADVSELEQQLKIIEPYLPETLSQEAMEEAVRRIINELPQEERILKNIMPKIKAVEGFDMKAAKPIIDKILAE